MLLQALRAREEIENVLSSPIPSASQIIKDAENVYDLLHKDFETAQDPQARREEHNHLLNLMSNITQQIEQFPPEGSDIGPALHAARQVGYWSSVFISMISNNASNPTNMSTSLPNSTATVFSSGVNLSSLTTRAPIPSTTNQSATCTTAQLTPSIQLSTTQHSSTSFIASSFNHPSLPITTAAVTLSAVNPCTLASQALIPSTINQAAPTTRLTPSIQSSTTQHPPTNFIPSSFNYPSLPITVAPFTSSGFNPFTLASQALIPSTICQSASTTQLTPSIQSSTTQHPPTSFIPSSFNHPALPISTAPVTSLGVDQSTINQAAPATFPTPSIQALTTQHPSTSVIPSSFNSPAVPISIVSGVNPSTQASQVVTSSAQATHATSASYTDPATMAVFREYGSGLLNEWLDSLSIPRNVENLQQVKEIWEVGNVNCLPLHKWTVVMRNYRSKTGKNSSMFSQRKYIYNLFKNCNFDENLVLSRYNELRPGKLYKILNTKSK